MKGFPDFVSEKESGILTYEVQTRENDRQSGYQKVWDMVLSDYVRLIGLEMCD